MCINVDFLYVGYTSERMKKIDYLGTVYNAHFNTFIRHIIMKRDAIQGTYHKNK